MNNIKRGGRFSFRSNKRYSYSRSNNSFAHNKIRPKGNIPLMYEKYIKLAKEASSAGDRIQAEYYHQFADHYSRVMTENGIKTTEQENTNKTSDKEFVEDSDTANDQEISKTTTSTNAKSSEKIDKEKEEVIDENENSLDTVSFISKPASKKASKSKK